MTLALQTAQASNYTSSTGCKRGFSALDEDEASVSESDNPESPDFTPVSENESVCTFCLAAVRSFRGVFLEAAENVHRQLCPVKPRGTAARS
jgi:hypothetical protein